MVLFAFWHIPTPHSIICPCCPPSIGSNTTATLIYSTLSCIILSAITNGPPNLLFLTTITYSCNSCFFFSCKITSIQHLCKRNDVLHCWLSPIFWSWLWAKASVWSFSLQVADSNSNYKPIVDLWPLYLPHLLILSPQKDEEEDDLGVAQGGYLSNLRVT